MDSSPARRHCRRRVTRLLAAAALILHAVAGLTHEAPRPVVDALTAAGISPHNVAIWVHAVDAEQPSVQFNAETPMNPASVMKLVTAFAAIDALGAAHTWTTRIATNGALENGILGGDLVIVGGGDPVLGFDRLWKLLYRLRALGVHTIRGDIVLDDGVLRLPAHDPHAFDGRGLRPYNSGPYGLLLHFNTVHLHLQPGASPGQPVHVSISPPLSGITIENRIQTSAGACGAWHRQLDATLSTGAGQPALVLNGTLPASCGARDWSAAPFAPAEYARALVDALWREVGGNLEGTVRTISRRKDAGRQLQTLITDASPALAEVVREMNKWSSNVIARQLLAYLAREDTSQTDMVAAGAARAAERLRIHGIEIDGLVIENGSGLSRNERIRADRLGQLLLVAWRQPWMPEFISALPVAGSDGTAFRRLTDSPARGHAHVKTGTINHVRAIAGYVLDRDGRRHVVVMMVNDLNAHASTAAQDALLEWVWSGDHTIPAPSRHGPSH